MTSQSSPGAKPSARCPLMRCWATILVAAVLLPGCAESEPDRTEPNPLQQPPIDPVLADSVSVSREWGYQQMVEVDLQGDGTTEVLVVAADVATSPTGEPYWEDGHRWMVRVDDDSESTQLFSGFVPNGQVEAGILTGDAGRHPVLIVQRTPFGIRFHEVEYLAPGDARLISSANYMMDQWVPRGPGWQ